MASRDPEQPVQSSGTPKSVRVPAKYAGAWALASESTESPTPAVAPAGGGPKLTLATPMSLHPKDTGPMEVCTAAQRSVVIPALWPADLTFPATSRRSRVPGNFAGGQDHLRSLAGQAERV